MIVAAARRRCEATTAKAASTSARRDAGEPAAETPAGVQAGRRCPGVGGAWLDGAASPMVGLVMLVSSAVERMTPLVVEGHAAGTPSVCRC